MILYKQSLIRNGFTLVELIMVIVITGIVAGMVSIFIQKPIEGYINLSRRAQLVDAADTALQMMARDIRQALPNSIRCNATNTSIEMLNTVDGVRYRIGGYAGGSDPAGQLDVTSADASFDSIGLFQNLNVTPLFSSNAYRLSIYNLGAPGYDAYQISAASTSGVMTPPGMSITIQPSTSHTGEDQITLGGSGWTFGTDSPRQRLFVVDGPIGYVCDTSAGKQTLTRYSNYPINAALTLPPGSGTAAVAATFVTSCQFNYQAGAATHNGLVTMALTLTDGGESINLLRQVHVDNAP